jgi:hypothetical protein
MISLYRYENKLETPQDSNAAYQLVLLKGSLNAFTPLKQLDSGFPTTKLQTTATTRNISGRTALSSPDSFAL